MVDNMIITHHGGQCIKVTFGDLTLVFDPISKKGTLPAVRFGADIALVSRDHPDFNGVEEVSYGEKIPFVIDGPGEYERSGVTVQGFLTKGPEGALNTAYVVNLEDMTLVHFGALASKELSQEAREALDDIDVLFVPIGGSQGKDEEVLSPSEAHKFAVSLEPHIIVPIHWSGMGTEKSLEAFLKEEGGAPEKVDKLTFKKKDALTRDGDIIVLTP